MGSFLGDYGVELASGATLGVVTALAAGLRRWATNVGAKVDKLGETLHAAIERVHARIDQQDRQASKDRERIVRLETVLLLSPTPQRGSERALEALTDTLTSDTGPDAS